MSGWHHAAMLLEAADQARLSKLGKVLSTLARPCKSVTSGKRGDVERKPRGVGKGVG